ncbi:hypothetical protein [Tsukamurella soli]|uniref:hypothetical protein n=1 Tax=Tsukamurella soli TaxID=644556 RepID=UPI00361205AF
MTYETRDDDGQLPVIRFIRQHQKPVRYEPSGYGLDLNNVVSALDLVTAHRAHISGREIAAVLAFDPPDDVAVGDSIDATIDLPASADDKIDRQD